MNAGRLKPILGGLVLAILAVPLVARLGAKTYVVTGVAMGIALVVTTILVFWRRHKTNRAMRDVLDER